MKKLPAHKTDTRPRFGWSENLDNDPEIIDESKLTSIHEPVAVIPIPFMSLKLKKQIREFTKTLWPVQ